MNHKFNSENVLIRSSSLEIEVKKDMKVAGYASVWNIKSPYMEERIIPNCFSKSLIQRDQIALKNHNYDLVLGRKSKGTLLLSEDSKGLYFELSLPNTNLGKDVYASVERGDIMGCSFGAIPQKITYNKEEGISVRQIEEASLLEVSLTPIPAFPDTEVYIRSLNLEDMTQEEVMFYKNQIEEYLLKYSTENKVTDEQVSEVSEELIERFNFYKQKYNS